MKYWRSRAERADAKVAELEAQIETHVSIHKREAKKMWELEAEVERLKQERER